MVFIVVSIYRDYKSCGLEPLVLFNTKEEAIAYAQERVLKELSEYCECDGRCKCDDDCSDDCLGICNCVNTPLEERALVNERANVDIDNIYSIAAHYESRYYYVVGVDHAGINTSSEINPPLVSP